MKVKTTAQLKKELDKYFSLYIRLSHPPKCFTCGRMFTVKTLQCGHFITRNHTATRWDENNCRPQCAGCNMFGGGKPFDFEENLIKEIGEEKVRHLKSIRHQITKLTRDWYEERIAFYKNRVKELENANGSI